MPSNLKLSQTIRHAMLNQITSNVGGNAIWRIYAASQPAGPDTATSGQLLLAELTCGATFAGSAGTPTANTLTLNTITQDSSANATGQAAWWRISTSGGVGHIDGSCGTIDADLILNSTSITAGAVVQISSASFTAGNA
jgi:hypothetical protein